MKKIYLLMAITCMTATHCLAQDVSTQRDVAQFGGKIGTNYSNVYDADDESFDAKAKFGLVVGFFASLPLGDILGLQPELLFSQKGYKADGNLFGSSYEFTRTSNYIDVPLLVSIKPTEELTILAGPQFSFLLSQKNKFESSQSTIAQEEAFENENIRKNTVCFTGGIDLNLNRTVISGRVGWDLFNNNGDGTSTTPRYNNAWSQLTAGYRF